MTQNYFQAVDTEKVAYLLIKEKTKGVNLTPWESNLLFNKNMYNAIFSFKEQRPKEFVLHGIKKTIFYFIKKEEKVEINHAIINNYYQILNTQNSEFIIDLLSGMKSNIVILDNDAAKVGALLALCYITFGLTKLDILEKTFNLDENVI